MLPLFLHLFSWTGYREILKSVLCVMAPIVLLKHQKENRNDEKNLIIISLPHIFLAIIDAAIHRLPLSGDQPR